MLQRYYDNEVVVSDQMKLAACETIKCSVSFAIKVSSRMRFSFIFSVFGI